MAGLTIRQILFPTDFSDAARLAGTTAFDLARQFGARLHVLHVVPPVTDPTPAPAHLRAVAEELDRGLSPVTAITSGFPARQIVAYARKNAIDLIVIGTHGRTGVTRALLGSVVEAVVRRAPCRVLTVPPELHAAPPAGREMVEAPETTSCAVCGANCHGWWGKAASTSGGMRMPERSGLSRELDLLLRAERRHLGERRAPPRGGAAGRWSRSGAV